jgi:hypothetical protein
VRNINVNHFQVSLSDSLKSTLYVMRELERIAINDKNFVAWVKSNFNKKCGTCLLKEIWNYIQNNFQYVEDSFDEVVISPVWLLDIKQGDCDDFALFIHTILTIMGVSSKYILLGATKQFTHIAVYSMGMVIDGANPNFNIIPTKYKFYEFA